MLKRAALTTFGIFGAVYGGYKLYQYIQNEYQSKISKAVMKEFDNLATKHELFLLQKQYQRKKQGYSNPQSLHEEQTIEALLTFACEVVKISGDHFQMEKVNILQSCSDIIDILSKYPRPTNTNESIKNKINQIETELNSLTHNSENQPFAIGANLRLRLTRFEEMYPQYLNVKNDNLQNGMSL